MNRDSFSRGLYICDKFTGERTVTLLFLMKNIKLLLTIYWIRTPQYSACFLTHIQTLNSFPPTVFNVDHLIILFILIANNVSAKQYAATVTNTFANTYLVHSQVIFTSLSSPLLGALSPCKGAFFYAQIVSAVSNLECSRSFSRYVVPIPFIEKPT